MAWVNIKDMTIKQLEAAVSYANSIHSIVEGRRDKRPLKADHQQAFNENFVGKQDFIKVKDFLIVPFLSIHKISIFEDEKWFAFPPDTLAVGMRDSDGDTTLVMGYEQDSFKGDTIEEAVLRCYVYIVLCSGGMEMPD